MEFVNLLIDKGLGDFIDGRTDGVLLQDAIYMRIMEQAEELLERLQKTELSEAQEEIIDNYVATIFDASERACRIAYMTCLKDIVRFLLEMQNE